MAENWAGQVCANASDMVLFDLALFDLAVLVNPEANETL